MCGIAVGFREVPQGLLFLEEYIGHEPGVLSLEAPAQGLLNAMVMLRIRRAYCYVHTFRCACTLVIWRSLAMITFGS
jgi:hypothetical protein